MTLRGLSGLNEQNERSRQQATVRAAHLQHELIYLPCVGQSHTAATVQATAAARAAEREAEESRRAGMLPAEAFEAGLLPLQDALAQGGEQQRQLEEAVEVLRHELREAEAATARHAAALAGASASEVRQHARHHPFGIAAITSQFFVARHRQMQLKKSWAADVAAMSVECDIEEELDAKQRERLHAEKLLRLANPAADAMLDAPTF